MPRNRIGTCCGGSAPEGGPLYHDIDSIGAIEVFLKLVDTHATVRQYQIKFNWSKATLNYKLTQINMYRRTYAVAQKIKKLMADTTDMESVRPEINRLRRLMWRDGPFDEV